MAPTLDRLDHVHIFVTDRAASEAWYARVLGFVRMPELVFWSPEGGPLTIANPAETIHLALFERPAEVCRSTVAFAAGATEFLAWREHLASELGRPVEVEDHQVAWSLYFRDPDGNPFEITTYDYAEVAAKLHRGT